MYLRPWRDRDLVIHSDFRALLLQVDSLGGLWGTCLQGCPALAAMGICALFIWGDVAALIYDATCSRPLRQAPWNRCLALLATALVRRDSMEWVSVWSCNERLWLGICRLWNRALGSACPVVFGEATCYQQGWWGIRSEAIKGH